MKAIFQAIRTKLKSVPGIAYVSLWKNQLQNMDAGEHTPFPCPAVLVEFLQPDYRTKLNRCQIGHGIVRIHLVERALSLPQEYESYDDGILSLYESVHAALQGLGGIDGPEDFKDLDRVTMSIDTIQSGLVVTAIDYRTHWNDQSAKPGRQTINITGIDLVTRAGISDAEDSGE